MTADRIVLRTARLEFREVTAADLPFVRDTLGDPQVMQYFGPDFHAGMAGAWIAKQRERYATDGYGYWLARTLIAVGEIPPGEPVGLIGLLETEFDGVRRPGLGYILARRAWGHGLATEGARGVLDHARQELGRFPVYVLIRPENRPSMEVARRLGLVAQGTTRFHGFAHTVFVTPDPGFPS